MERVPTMKPVHLHYVNDFIEYYKQKTLWHNYSHMMEAEVVMKQKLKLCNKMQQNVHSESNLTGTSVNMRN